jgi:peptide/nickel transport system permease protein
MTVLQPAATTVQSRTRRLPALAGTPKLDLIGFVLFGVIVLLALLAPLLGSDPTVQVAAPLQAPSLHHLLGTDDIGEDMWSRVLYGTRTSLAAAAVVVAAGVLIGSLIGLIAGAAGRWIDAVLMRLTDTFLALPAPVLAIAIVASLGPSLPHTVIAVTVVWWPWYARLVRGEVRALAARPHMEAARLAGVSRPRLLLRHLMPGAVPPVLIAASLDVQILVLTLAGLSFLGLGSPPPAPELGAMAARGADYLFGQPWVPLAPGAALFLIAIAANLAGDGIRDIFERRS